jgi:Tfp pilus assembly protein PilE
MYGLKKDGIAGIEMMVLFTIVGILTFTAAHYYASLTNHAHDANVNTMYSMISASVMGAVDKVTVVGSKCVPNPS